jgi:hypothetical protein
MILIFMTLFASLLVRETGVLFISAVVLYRIFIRKSKIFFFLMMGTVTTLLYLVIRISVIGPYIHLQV